MNGSRFHIEINSIKVDDMAVRFNIFGDTLAQVTADLQQVIAYVTGAVPPPSKSMPSVGARVSGASPAVPPVALKLPPPSAKTGTCIGCGSDALEWVTGTRKDNHKPFAAYKCQECGKWQPEARS